MLLVPGSSVILTGPAGLALLTATPADGLAVPATDILEALTLQEGLAPDGALDWLRTVGDTAALGLGVLATSPRTPGASEVQAHTAAVTVNETTRSTQITPTSGARIRILFVGTYLRADGNVEFECYFGTGANVDTTPANAIARYAQSRDVTNNTQNLPFVSFPDGAGPIGAVDAVVSVRAASLDNYNLIILYREE